MENTAMLNLRNEGLSNLQIAERLGVSYHTVRKNIGKQSKTLTAANIKAAKAYSRTKHLIAEYERERIRKEKYDALALELKFHTDAITAIRAEMNKLTV